MGLQYGIKEVFKLTFWDFVTGKPFAYADYAQVTNNEITAERIDLRGGRGNSKIMSFDHTKNSVLTLNLPLVDLNLLSLLGSEDLVTGAANVYKREELTITAGAAVIAETPIDGSVVVYELAGLRDNGQEYTNVASAPAGNQFSITGKNMTFDVTKNGEKIVVWYQYATPTTAQKISIRPDKFPKTVKITGESIWRNQEDDTDTAVFVTIYKAKAQNNFTLTMSATAATTLELKFDMYEFVDTSGKKDYIDYVVL